MLDTIIYIPTILAYVFIALLVIILCFIVVYVSHRIYVTIYDNLPVTPSALSSIWGDISMKQQQAGTGHSSIMLKSTRSCLDAAKPKTALRIIISLEPCYLAYVTYELERRPSASVSGMNELVKSSDSKHSDNKLVKYYDRLSEIPIATFWADCFEQNGKMAPHRLWKGSRRPRVLGTSGRPTTVPSPTVNADRKESAETAAAAEAGAFMPVAGSTKPHPFGEKRWFTNSPNAIFTNAMKVLAQNKTDTDSSSGGSLTAVTTQLYTKDNTEIHPRQLPRTAAQRQSDEFLSAVSQTPQSQLSTNP